MTLFGQLERFEVQRYKFVRAIGKWSWVTIGFFPAIDKTEARKLGRDALADKTCILRAELVGKSV